MNKDAYKKAQKEWEEQHQVFERNWHGDCCNTYSEEAKQIVYANRMGLPLIQTGSGHWPEYNGLGKLILDIGGGPASLLLKFENRDGGVIVDPCAYPGWVSSRYMSVGLLQIKMPAEDYTKEHTDLRFDMVLCYNVLQHTIDPQRVIENMLDLGKQVRIFEWINTEHTLGHPHVFTADQLDHWLGDKGTSEFINESGAVGECYYGVFKGRVE